MIETLSLLLRYKGLVALVVAAGAVSTCIYERDRRVAETARAEAMQAVADSAEAQRERLEDQVQVAQENMRQIREEADARLRESQDDLLALSREISESAGRVGDFADSAASARTLDEARQLAERTAEEARELEARNRSLAERLASQQSAIADLRAAEDSTRRLWRNRYEALRTSYEALQRASGAREGNAESAKWPLVVAFTVGAATAFLVPGL